MEMKACNIYGIDCILDSKYLFPGACDDDDERHDDQVRDDEYDLYMQCGKEAGALKTRTCRYHDNKGLLK